MYFGDDFDAILDALEADEAFDDQFTTAVNDVSIELSKFARCNRFLRSFKPSLGPSLILDHTKM